MIEYTPKSALSAGVHTDIAEKGSRNLFVPELLPVNKLSSLSELVTQHQYALFTPAVLYCFMESFDIAYDPFAESLPSKTLKQIKVTSLLPEPLFSGFTGTWQHWERKLYVAPQEVFHVILAALSGNGFIHESAENLIIVGFNDIHVPDVIGRVNGQVPNQVRVHALGVYTTKRSIILWDTIEEGEPQLLQEAADPRIVEFAKSLFQGAANPFRALKKRKEPVIKSYKDVPLKRVSDLKPAVRKKASELADVYNMVLRDVPPIASNDE